MTFPYCISKITSGLRMRSLRGLNDACCFWVGIPLPNSESSEIR